MGTRLSVLFLTLLIATSSASLAAMCGIAAPPNRFPDNNQGVPVALSETADALVFRLRAGQMSLDVDGNEHTYGVRDQGIDMQRVISARPFGMCRQDAARVVLCRMSEGLA